MRTVLSSLSMNNVLFLSFLGACTMKREAQMETKIKRRKSKKKKLSMVRDVIQFLVNGLNMTPRGI